jgi:uncharacterized protein YndB with AHSA1/START domain
MVWNHRLPTTLSNISLVLWALVPASVALDAHAEIKSASSDGFIIVYSRRVGVAPGKVYAALPAIDRWWSSDHTWSGSAANLSLKAEAGSCFCERWKDGEVEHGRVVMVLRDQLFRLQTALGPLQGRAVTGIMDFQLKPDEGAGGTATLLTLTYTVNGAAGSALDKSATPVNGVLGEQFERLVRYIETGRAAAQ